MDNYQHISFTIEDRVGRITLARPPLNILHIAMMREIDDALNACSREREMVAIMFEAAPDARVFSAGVAVEEHVPETIYQMLESFHDIFRTLEEIAKPVVAAVDGAALGGGCELVAACDIVIASERARFGQPEIKLGVFPPIAAIWLPRIIGERRARELILTGEMFDAQEALRFGLVNYTVEQAQLETKTQEVLGRLRELSASSLEATRRALDMGRSEALNERLAKVEDFYLNDLMRTEDAQEGISAFIEKRKPVWRNR